MEMYLSYLIGAEGIMDDELEDLRITIAKKTDAGARMLKIPPQSLPAYIALIKNKLTKGFWNEIIGKEAILFIFRFKDGHNEEYTLSPKNESLIDKLCAEFNSKPPEKTANVYRYLSHNAFYHEYMVAHYSDMINRLR